MIDKENAAYPEYTPLYAIVFEELAKRGLTTGHIKGCSHAIDIRVKDPQDPTGKRQFAGINVYMSAEGKCCLTATTEKNPTTDLDAVPITDSAALSTMLNEWLDKQPGVPAAKAGGFVQKYTGSTTSAKTAGMGC